MTKIYYDYNARFAQSDRADLIRKGEGMLTPITPTKGVKVQIIEVDAAELRIWLAAKESATANAFAGFGGRR
jgi:hypothetical protein